MLYYFPKPVLETRKFYSVLSSIGTDFSLMMKYFPDCPRKVLKVNIIFKITFVRNRAQSGNIYDHSVSDILLF